MTTAGTELRATGIEGAPSYDFAPPDAFFAKDMPALTPVFDVRDFGAVADPSIDNRPMIQAAIDAAHEAGGGIVYIPSGVYGIAAGNAEEGSVQIKSNVFLKGEGMGETVLRLVDGSSQDVTGLVRTQWGVETSNCGVADLTIDGNQANTSGLVDGFFTGPVPGQPISDKDVFLTRVEIHDVSRYGFDPHETTLRLSIQDSVAHHNGVDGFVLDRIVGGDISNNESYANGRHGFNVVTTSENLILANNVSHDNGGAGIVVQRGSEDIPAPSLIAISGGDVYGNGREGVLLQGVSNVSVSGLRIHDNGMSGVRIYGSDHVTVSGNTITANSQSEHDAYSEVMLQTWNDVEYGHVFKAQDNLIQGNTIVATGDIQARFGVEERDGNVANNIVFDNKISGTVRGPMALNGDGSYLLKIGTDAANSLIGGSAQDKLMGYAGNDRISGGDGNDRLEGGDGNDLLYGGKGKDILEGGAGRDTLYGNSDDDTMSGNDGNDALYADTGNDALDGGAGNDVVSGGSGDDWIKAGAGNDKYDGGTGYDTLDFSGFSGGVSVDLSLRKAVGFETGTDALNGFERVIGSSGADTLTGDKNVNLIEGGAGDDTLRGMGGKDTLTGGEGHDTFSWLTKDVVSSGVYLGRDTITDFSAEDALDLTSLLAGRTYGTLDDLVTVTSSDAGTAIAVDIKGIDYEIAFLENFHATSASEMQAAGMILT